MWTKTSRNILIGAGCVVAITLMAIAAGVAVVRSDWFREKVRERIVAEAAQATNGRVELGEFRFDWKTLTAELDNLTIHGTEPAGQLPLFAVRRLIVGLKIISLMDRTFNIARVEADGPRAHLIIQPDGNTNIPPPHKLTPQTILDLKISRFAVKDGVVVTEAPGQEPRDIPWNAHGENLAAQASYDPAKARYSGKVLVEPVHFQWNDYGAVDARVEATAAMEKNRVTVSRATFTTIGKIPSAIDLRDVLVDGFTAPVVTAKYEARLQLDEIDRVFRLVAFQHTGTIGVAGTARFGSMTDYLVSGSVDGAGIGYGGVRNLRASGKFEADPQKVLLSDLHLHALTGEITASGEVRNLASFSIAGQLAHFNVSQLVSLADMAVLPYDGVISGPFHATGTLSEQNLHDLLASATVDVAPAATGVPVRGQLTGSLEGASGTLEFGNSWLALPSSRVDFSGIPGKRLDVRLESKDLNELRPAIALPPALRKGEISFNGTVSGSLTDPRLAGSATIRNAIFDDQQIDSLSGDFTASNALVTVTGVSLSGSGLQVQGSGSLGLSKWKPDNSSAVNVNLRATNADLTRVFELIGWKNAPVSGSLNTTAQITGTVGDPHATADLTLARGQIYGEPFDSLTGHAQYVNGGAQTLTAAIGAGANRLSFSGRFEPAAGASGRFEHAAGASSAATPLSGKLTFNLASNTIPLNQIALVRAREPDLQGSAQIRANGAVEVSVTQGQPHFTVLDLNGQASATALALGPRSFGDARISAATDNGTLTARIESNAVKAAIRGEGTMRLAGDYPIDAKVTFSDVQLSAVETGLGLSRSGYADSFDGSFAGQMTLQGPARTPDLITASFDIGQFELHPVPAAGQPEALQTLVLRNDGPIRMELARSMIRIEAAHLQGPETNIQVSGSVALDQRSPLNVDVKGNVNLALAHTFNQDFTSSGELVVNATVRGTFDNPDFSGRADLQKGEFHYADFANGLTNANGVLIFNGARANIQSFTAETGGGKVDASGFIAMTGGALGFRIESKASGVRIRYPEGVSSISDADLTLAGTPDRSEASGKITVRRISINPTSDAGGILTGVAEPARTPEARTGLLANMNLDIQIETAPDVSFQTSVAQSVEADASLRLRGTATNRALLGRINITQGQLVFFGNKYTISQGSISFLNPAKIDPILNIGLETKARGVDVELTISGPINKLNVSYRSDPPLQFGDILALLATGRAPSNATLESAGTGQSQNFQQLGASALLEQTLSNPSQGRLQRFFGVSNIKLDPELIGITGSPEARLSIEQQVAPNILFTYVSDVTDTSTQLIRVELDFNARWGAILTREENGYVNLDFAYRRRFK